MKNKTENKKIITIYVDEDIAKELKEKAINFETSVNGLINTYLKIDLLDFIPPRHQVLQQLQELERYFEDEEKKNKEEIEYIKANLELINCIDDDNEIRLRKAKLEKELSDCTNKIKILDEKKESINIIRKKIKYLF